MTAGQAVGVGGVICPAQYIEGGGGGGAVSSVFGRSGTVVAATGDYTYTQVGADQAGAAAAVLATVVDWFIICFWTAASAAASAAALSFV